MTVLASRLLDRQALSDRLSRTGKLFRAGSDRFSLRQTLSGRLSLLDRLFRIDFL
jgi:hypothetical protein